MNTLSKFNYENLMLIFINCLIVNFALLPRLEIYQKLIYDFFYVIKSSKISDYYRFTMHVYF